METIQTTLGGLNGLSSTQQYSQMVQIYAYTFVKKCN